MYNFLKTHLPELLANMLMATWYALIVLGCLYGLTMEMGEFRYADW